MADYDIIGNIAIIKKDSKTKKELKVQAKKVLKRPGIKTVLAKANKVSGRLRTIKTDYIMGKKNKIAEYKENNCKFSFDVEKCYFSPRLSGDRKDITDKIKSSDSVLVMFAGVGVYPIVIFKELHPKKIVAVEIGRECVKYFKKNLDLNKISKGKIEVISGDVSRIIKKDFRKFNVVIMARPNLKKSFLEYGLNASKKGTKLFYYAFCNVNEIENVTLSLIKEAKKYKRKIKLVKKIRAGDIAPYKYRYRIEFKVIN